MRSFVTTVAALLVTLVAYAGCGDGLDNAEATARCNEIRASLANPNCMDDAIFQQCVGCMEECGIRCGVVESVCPVTTSCGVD